MPSDAKKLIAIVGASGQQGGAVLRALRAGSQFRVRALTRSSARHPHLGNDVVEADLDRPETLNAAFAGAHGVFLMTNFLEAGADEIAQATNAIRAAKAAGVNHLIWSTLPDVERISDGNFNVPHFTNKASVDAIVRAAGFAHYTFVVAPMYYQSLLGPLAPRPQANGALQWALPLDPAVRCLHMGDIWDFGHLVAGAFEQPSHVGNGAYLPLVGDFLSFNDVIDRMRRQGYDCMFTRIPDEHVPPQFAQMLRFLQAHTYLGPDLPSAAARADAIMRRRGASLAAWLSSNFRPGVRAC